jgi:hypothetical protein
MRMTGKELGLEQRTVPEFAWTDLGKPRKYTVDVPNILLIAKPSLFRVANLERQWQEISKALYIVCPKSQETQSSKCVFFILYYNYTLKL